jgi:2-oxoglutarate ferredoxin oxidoreductase subunit gamma
MNQKSLDTYYHDLKPGGLLVVDSTFVNEVPPGGVIAIPFTRLAREQLGREVAANIVALGALAALTDAVTPSSLEAAVLARVPKGTEDLNRRALSLGVDAARQAALAKV